MNDFNSISSLLRYEREKHGMTIKAFAEYLNISMSALDKYERGVVEPGIKAVYKISKALGYKPSYLIDLIKSRNPFVQSTAIRRFSLSDDNTFSHLPEGYVYTSNLHKKEIADNHICVCKEEKCYLFILKDNKKRLGKSPYVITEQSNGVYKIAILRDNVVYDIKTNKKHKCQKIIAQFKREINKK